MASWIDDVKITSRIDDVKMASWIDDVKIKSWIDDVVTVVVEGHDRAWQ